MAEILYFTMVGSGLWLVFIWLLFATDLINTMGTKHKPTFLERHAAFFVLSIPVALVALIGAGIWYSILTA